MRDERKQRSMLIQIWPKDQNSRQEGIHGGDRARGIDRTIEERMSQVVGGIDLGGHVKKTFGTSAGMAYSWKDDNQRSNGIARQC